MDRVTGIHPTDARGLYVLKHFSQLCLGLDRVKKGAVHVTVPFLLPETL